MLNSPDDRLDAYATRALSRWKFLPAEKAGKSYRDRGGGHDSVQRSQVFLVQGNGVYWLAEAALSPGRAA